LAEAPAHLTAAGLLLMELSPMLAERARAMATEEFGFGRAEMIKDLAGQSRVLSAQMRPSTVAANSTND
jgi:hypothetical protein